MVIRSVLAAAFVLSALPAWAQPAPPPAPETPGPGGAPSGQRPPPPPRGAMFKIERHDLELTVRCADGDTTRACGEIVSQMIEKLAAMPAGARPPERAERSRDDDRGGRWDEDRDRRERRYRDF